MKVSITIEDTDNGTASFSMDYEPPITTETPHTRASLLGQVALEAIIDYVKDHRVTVDDDDD